MSSLRRLSSLSPSLLYPGHGPVVTDAVSKIQQYLDHRDERERQASQVESQELLFIPLLLILASLSLPSMTPKVLEQLSRAEKPTSVAELVDHLYPGLHPDLLTGARNNISNHLQKLEEEQRIRELLILSLSPWLYFINHIHWWL